eukprot:863534_1
MLITAQDIGKGNVWITLVSQSVSMLILLVFAFNWTFSNLGLYGLTYNEPVFPFSVSILRSLHSLGFFCGFGGCVIQILIHTGVIQINPLLIMIVCVMVIGFILFTQSKRPFVRDK